MNLNSTYSSSVRMLLLIASLVSLTLLGACERPVDARGESEVPISSASAAEQVCKLDTGALRKLRDDVSESRSAGSKDGLLKSQETLQRWMEECSASASEFDRIGVSGLWNRLGESWASQNELDNADRAFAQALSLLRTLPQSEELLIALRGKADCEWKLERRKEGSALAREQLNTARTMNNGSIPAAHHLIDALEFAARFAGMDGDQAESARLSSEAQLLRKSIESMPIDNSVPAPTPQQ